MHRLKRTIFTPSVVVFIAVMVVVIISFLMARNSMRAVSNAVVISYVQDNEDSIKDRLNIFEETLRGGVGLLASNPTLTNEQWQQFIKTSGVLDRYPGGQAINYAKIVSKDQIGVYVAKAKTEISPDFNVWPSAEKVIYIPLTYFAPYSESNKQFYGFDISSDPTRNRALTAARDSGEVALSDTIQSFVDKTDEGRAFVMYVPQYKTNLPINTEEQRRTAIAGYVYAGFRVNKFITNISSQKTNPNIAFTIKVEDSKDELYKSSNYDDITKARHAIYTSELRVGSTELHFSYAYRESAVLPSYVVSRPVAVLIFGTLTALLVASAVLLVLRGKANELLLEQERGINDAKDNLLSLASHQLRTPATGVKQYLGLLLQGFSGDVTPNQQEILEKAYASNERQLKTINDILYLARLGSGRIVLSKSEFSPVILVQDVVKDLDAEIREKQHKVRVKVPKRQKNITGDEHMIRMAVENLVTNAVKYTHKNGRITVQVVFASDNIKIHVQDNGVGIPEDHQERMFQQFERIDNELSIVVGGTGIGLYVVQTIVELHGGHVEVASSADKGSTFTLVLPYRYDGENVKV